ncbi:MAG: acetoacetate decarboxylase family protein [Spongiibacter sp.]
MLDTRIHAPEAPVDGNQATDTVCRKIDDRHYRINGQDITLPVTVGDAAMLMNLFTVDSKAAQALIADTGFKVVELWPGKALLQLLAVDYRQNDLGDYNEAAIVFPATTPGERSPLPLVGALPRILRGQLGNYVYRMPVNQGFTTHAGRYIWGFPKWQCDVDVQFGKADATARFSDENMTVFELHARCGGKASAKAQQAPSLAIRNQRAWKTVGTTEGEGLTFRLGGKAPVIGNSHPLALALRALGLPKKPLCTIAIRQARMSFEGPESVPIGSAFSQ